MSQGYWRGPAVSGQASRDDASSFDWEALGGSDATRSHTEGRAGSSVSSGSDWESRRAVAPGKREGGGQGGYWQGSYRAPMAPADDSPRGSSVTARARRAYAAEALRTKDHVSAGLLAIFLGMFGVHKFYLGCNSAGFIMLAVSIIGGIVTFGLAAAVIEVIAVIEGVIYLTKSQTDFDRTYVLNQRDWF